MMTPKSKERDGAALSAALAEVVDALGGPGVVGPILKPRRDSRAAAQWLAAALDPERREQLGLDDITFLLMRGANVGCHSAMNVLCRHTGYRPPKVAGSAAERLRLQLRAIATVDQLTRILFELTSLDDGRAAGKAQS